MKNKGFTLIELLAVIVIVSILVGVAVMSYSRQIKTSKEKELVTLKSTIKAEFNSYRTYNTVSKDSNVLLGEFTDVDLEFFSKKLNMNTSYIYFKVMGDYFDPVDPDADLNVCIRTNNNLGNLNGNGQMDDNEIEIVCTDEPSLEEHYCYYLEDIDGNLILDSKNGNGDIPLDEYCQ